ncbi:GNAT family N-acetyltransferase [Lonepinella koalarum]
MFNISPLNLVKLDRSRFQSQSEELNQYFCRFASQDEKRGLSKCYVLHNKLQIIGFYTLSAYSVPLDLLPNVAQKVRYRELPVALLGRLAVDQHFAGQGFGSVLLYDAIERIKQSELATTALVVVAKDENATQFYRHFGFIPFEDPIRHFSKPALFYPLSKIFNGVS